MSAFAFPLGALGLLVGAVDRRARTSLLDRSAEITRANLAAFRAEIDGLDDRLAAVQEPLVIAIDAMVSSIETLTEAADRATDENIETNDEIVKLQQQVADATVEFLQKIADQNALILPILQTLFRGTRTAGGLVRTATIQASLDDQGNVIEAFRDAVSGNPFPTGALMLTHGKQVPFGWIPVPLNSVNRLYIEDFPELAQVIGVTYGGFVNDQDGPTFVLPGVADLPAIPDPASGADLWLTWMIRA